MENDWQEEPVPGYPMLRGRRNADAVIVGGGFTGLHVALWLCRAGLRVALLEARTLGCGASSHCAGMAMTTRGARFKQTERLLGSEAAARYGASQNAAMQALRELCAEKGMRSAWRDMDAFLVSQTESETLALEREAAAMARAGFASALTEATQCPVPTRKAIELKNQATLRPTAHLRSVAKKACGLGLTIYEDSRVVGLESNLAYTQRGSVLAPYIVVATGFPILNIPGWYFPRLTQTAQALIPLLHADPFDGMYADLEGRFAARRVREGALFWQRGLRVGMPDDPLRTFQSRYAQAFPGASPGSVDMGCEVESADGLPFIGPYSSKTPNIFVATGYGGCGVVGSVVAAQAISARILGLTENGYELYAEAHRTRGALGQAVPVALGQVGRYLAGMARLRAPRCPHMGCKLIYDRRSHLWCCPCHGSRFDDIGRLRAAPAVRDAQIDRG